MSGTLDSIGVLSPVPAEASGLSSAATLASAASSVCDGDICSTEQSAKNSRNVGEPCECENRFATRGGLTLIALASALSDMGIGARCRASSMICMTAMSAGSHESAYFRAMLTS